jgi:hypothetical protein
LQQLAFRRETTDGSRPAARALGEDLARTLPLAAFSVLAGGGSAFEGTSAHRDVERARASVKRALVFTGARVERVHSDAIVMLRDNPRLADRVAHMKPVRVHVVAKGVPLSSAGFPRSVDERCAGVFWDQPRWSEARIGLRAEHLAGDPVLVVHEFAHALHRLAFTAVEQRLIDDVLMPTVGSRSDVDELFAIYSEAEHLSAFGVDDKQAPGIYGWARRQWSDKHLFTRFVRKLYFPGRPLAGEDAPRAGAWKKFAT